MDRGLSLAELRLLAGGLEDRAFRAESHGAVEQIFLRVRLQACESLSGVQTG